MRSNTVPSLYEDWQLSKVHIQIQFVPHEEYSSSLLERATGYGCIQITSVCEDDTQLTTMQYGQMQFLITKSVL
jgi:hypothetical protein